jgi:hypothetical protein
MRRAILWVSPDDFKGRSCVPDACDQAEAPQPTIPATSTSDETDETRAHHGQRVDAHIYDASAPEVVELLGR